MNARSIVRELVQGVVGPVETYKFDAEKVARELGLDTTRNVSGMYDAPYAALRVVMKDPTKVQNQIDRLTRLRASLTLGRGFLEPDEFFRQRNPNLVKRGEEAKKVIAFLQNMA
jgi:hypothetical protein